MKKTALITGMDTNAIARDICASLLKTNYEVVAIIDCKSKTGTEELDRFNANHPEFSQVRFEMVNLCSETSLNALIARLSNQKYDTLIFCATTLASMSDGSLRNEAIDFDYSEFNRVMQYNVSSVAAICLGIKDWINSGGTIINITTTAAKEGAFATISYNASKSAVENLTKSLANTLGISKGIRVNSIAPGWIPPSDDVASGNVVALANSLTPSLVNGKSGDIVKAVHYLINSSFQNGTVLSINGGITSSYLPYMLESLELQGVSMDETIQMLASIISKNKKRLESS